MVSSNVITILSVVTCLLTLTSVGLTAYHSVSHLYVKIGDVATTSAGTFEPCPPAIKVKSDENGVVTILSCPFKPATKAIAFISLILCQFLLILLCCKLKNKVSSMVIVIFAIIDFPLLLVGGILMIVDMINGKKEIGDTSGLSYQPIEFIIDILFVFFGLICGGAATFFAYTNRPPSHPSQPTQHGNASMSVTKPHWTEGESQSQSTDYIKPYPQPNISTYQAYQGGSALTSHNTSTAYLHNANNANTLASSSNGRGSQVYQPQNDQYLESSQNYDNTGGYGNRRNASYKDNPQTRQRQQSNANNFNYGGNQQGNNGYENNGGSYGNTPQRNVNRNMNNNLTYETNNANQNNYNNGNQNNYSNNNNSMAAGPQNRGNRNNYPGSNQSQMYANNNNNNDTTTYERSPERNPDSRSYANSGNGGNGRPNKFNSAVNRIGAMRGGANAFENGSNNRGYLNYGNDTNNQSNMNNYDENPLDYYSSSSPNNRGRARSNNQPNYEEQQYQEEGNYQRPNNQRNTHVSQINGNNIPYNNNNNGMGRPAANSIGNSRPSQNYAGGGY